VDDAIAIPFLAPERDALLEYELVRLISQLDDPAPPKVTVISSLTPFQLHPRPNRRRPSCCARRGAPMTSRCLHPDFVRAAGRARTR
jgi:hypothetical protein